MTSTQRWRLALGSILALACGLRLAYVFGSQASPYFERPIMDPLYHLEWARAFASGEAYQPGPFFRAPLYPWFLGTVLRLAGESLLLVRILQALLGTLTSGLGYVLARRFFDRRVALLSAFLIATNWVLIYFDGELLIPTLAIPLNLLALIASARLDSDNDNDGAKLKHAALAGLAWGVASLARPNVLLFLPLLAAWLLWRSRPALAKGLRTALALAAGTLAAVLPITTYNYVAGGDTVLVSSQAGVNLWIGNNPQSDGSSAIVPSTRPGWWEGFHDSIALAEQAEGRELKPSEVSSHYAARARRFMLDSPAAALRHMLWKLRLFWADWELGNNADVRFFATEFTPWMAWLPARFGLLAAFALLGLFFFRGHGAKLFPLWGFTFTYMASVVLFFVCARFRAPVLPLLSILASVGVFGLVDLARDKRWPRFTAGLLLAATAGFLTQQLPAGLDSTRSMGHWALGIDRLQQGDARGAQPFFRSALEQNPRNMFALRDLGAAQQLAGELLEATASYRAALELKPDEFQVRSSLVDVLIARGDLPGAEQVAREGLRLAPAFPQSYDSMARVFTARQDWAAAIGVLRAGLERAPDDYYCNLRLGGVQLQVGDPCAAIEHLERAARSPLATGAQALGLQQALAQARTACAAQ